MADRLIEALDLLEQGDWEMAHQVAQGDSRAAASWLHAHLHRVEGDHGNARYWYRQAGRAPFDGGEAEERQAIRREIEAGGIAGA